MKIRIPVFALLILAVLIVPVRAEGPWEVTPESELALERGLEWLARNQGPQGNWDSNDLGLVEHGHAWLFSRRDTCRGGESTAMSWKNRSITS